MSTSPGQAPHEAAMFRSIREWGITRGDNGVLGGVVEGLGNRVGMDRVPARIIVFVAALVLNGFVLLAYAAAWALLPDSKGNIIVQNFGRGIPNVGALIGIAVMTLFGLGSFDHGSGIFFSGLPWSGDMPWPSSSTWGPEHFILLLFALLIPLVVIGAVVTGIVLLVKKNNKSNAPVGPGAVYAAPPASSAQEAARPAHQWAPAPPAPPLPPRLPRVPGPGRAFYLLTLAWAPIAVASAVWLEREGRLAVHPAVAGFVLFVTGLGIILVLVSLAGRKLGFLGFVGFAALIPLLVFAGNADGLRAAYAHNGGIMTNLYLPQEYVPSTATIEEPVAQFDPTLQFPGLYTIVSFDGDCQEGAGEEYGSTSVARLNLAGPVTNTTTDTTIDITAEVTYVTISKGASITVSGDEDAQATVVFANRDFTCDFGDTGQQYLALTNPGTPTLKLVVHDDQYANTIVIKEVAS